MVKPPMTDPIIIVQTKTSSSSRLNRSVSAAFLVYMVLDDLRIHEALKQSEE